MKKIIIYTLILAIIGFLGYSAYKEATKTGAKAKRLPCHERVTVFERVHEAKAIVDFQSTRTPLSASIQLVPSTHQAPELFDIIPQSQIESLVKEHLGVELGVQNPLHVKIMVMENDKLDPNKKNDDAKSFLGYVRASYYKQNTLVYQIQIDFLEPNGIGQALKCIHESLKTL